MMMIVKRRRRPLRADIMTTEQRGSSAQAALDLIVREFICGSCKM
jgi:hypothetical protein